MEASARGTSRSESREALLDAAFDEMYLHGFRAAGIEVILGKSGVSKGSMYHHFGNKRGLGYAVVEERVKPLVRERYLEPFKTSDDPTEALGEMGRRMEKELRATGILERGCPVNNLVQEMSGVDDGFRRRLAEILEEWRDTIAVGLRRGQEKGTVSVDADPEEAATFVVAALMGGVGFAKNARDLSPFDHCRRVLDAYVRTLQPRRS
ncbi:MAG: TetR/AcrR family transcriptional regulator [Gemmatimonadota bacterium]|nr:TetR/AcrR family transcriptional regulator [Gemmatimonadota bacterium]